MKTKLTQQSEAILEKLKEDVRLRAMWHLDKRLPGHTGAIGQTQTIQQNQLAKMVVGFRDINAIGGGA